MTDAVIFDMFETLVTHYASPLYFGDQMAEDAGIDPAAFRKVWRATESDRTLGKITTKEAIRQTLQANGVYCEALCEKIHTKRIQTKKELFDHLHPEIIPLLDALKDRGIRIGLCSNCFSEEAEVIRESPLAGYFDAICLSCEMGLAKPDTAFLSACLEKLDTAPERCIFVGDGGSHELECAEYLGLTPLRAVWYQKIPDQTYPALFSPLHLLSHL